MVVGFCEFVGLSAMEDLVALAAAADRCAVEAADVIVRYAGTTERLLYDRVVARMPPDAPLAAFVDLRAATRRLGFEVAVGLADGRAGEPSWGRAHLLARSLSQAAAPGEILLEDRIHKSLDRGFRCEPAGVLAGVRAWRLVPA